MTGVARYNAVENALGKTRAPKWSDFIDENGQLLSAEYLANESAVARTARTNAIDKEMAIQRKALLDVQRQGFESPGIAPPPAVIVPPPAPEIIAPPPVVPQVIIPDRPASTGNRPTISPAISSQLPKTDLAKSKAGLSGKEVISNLERNYTPEAIRESIELFNAKSQDVSDVRREFLERIAPSREVLEAFNRLKAEWAEGQLKIQEQHRGNTLKSIDARAQLSAKLRAKYGDEMFLTMRRNEIPEPGNIHEVLAQVINPAGSVRENVKTYYSADVQADADMKAKAIEAKNWLNSLIPDDSPIDIEVSVSSTKGRAYAKSSERRVFLDPNSPARIFVHEIAHVLEVNTGQTLAASRAIRHAQAAGQEVQHLKTSLSDDYDDQEVSLTKSWKGITGSVGSYVGKYYPGDRATELVSMGLEYLYSDPAKLAKENPEYFDFLVNVLRGNYAK